MPTPCTPLNTKRRFASSLGTLLHYGNLLWLAIHSFFILKNPRFWWSRRKCELIGGGVLVMGSRLGEVDIRVVPRLLSRMLCKPESVNAASASGDHVRNARLSSRGRRDQSSPIRSVTDRLDLYQRSVRQRPVRFAILNDLVSVSPGGSVFQTLPWGTRLLECDTLQIHQMRVEELSPPRDRYGPEMGLFLGIQKISLTS